MTQGKHVHKLKLVKYKSGNRTFFCALPDCTYKINPALSLGKRSLCWRCGNEFILSEYTLRLVKPHCEACHKTKVDRVIEDSNSPNEGKTTERFIPDEIITKEVALSLAERLQQTIQQAKEKEEDLI